MTQEGCVKKGQTEGRRKKELQVQLLQATSLAGS